MKTLAIRLEDDVHAQLQVIAKLQESSIADEIRQAIDAHLQAKRHDPELGKRANEVRESIEHEAKLRQDAMATLFTEDYRAITDQHLERWKQHFTDEELIELGAFMALADGFGKLVEMLGLGRSDQTCTFEI